MIEKENLLYAFDRVNGEGYYHNWNLVFEWEIINWKKEGLCSELVYNWKILNWVREWYRTLTSITWKYINWIIKWDVYETKEVWNYMFWYKQWIWNERIDMGIYKNWKKEWEWIELICNIWSYFNWEKTWIWQEYDYETWEISVWKYDKWKKIWKWTIYNFKSKIETYYVYEDSVSVKNNKEKMRWPEWKILPFKWNYKNWKKEWEWIEHKLNNIFDVERWCYVNWLREWKWINILLNFSLWVDSIGNYKNWKKEGICYETMYHEDVWLYKWNYVDWKKEWERIECMLTEDTDKAEYQELLTSLLDENEYKFQWEIIIDNENDFKKDNGDNDIPF